MTAKEKVYSKQNGIDNNESITKKKNNEIKHNDVGFNRNSSIKEKVNLYMSIFRGREDVYAKRWEGKDGKSGYSPVCLNQWVKGICKKPHIKCSACDVTKYAKLDDKAIDKHLRGNEVLGLFPMLKDETCYFLAIDFDDDGWQKDVKVIREICEEKSIPFAVERSRSGNGAHVWFFFKESISATLARKFGTALLTYAMEKRYEIQFKSYDRLFPNQDTMPKGGLGNLIALPLQKKARNYNNSEFIDENFNSYSDQWAFLGSIRKISKEEIESIIFDLAPNTELGNLIQSDNVIDESIEKVNEKKELKIDDFGESVYINISNMIFINKSGLSSKTLNSIKRMAAFKNPEYYQAQRMRLPTYNKPRIISLSEDNEKYLCVPRGCEEEVTNLFLDHNVNVIKEDNTYIGKSINVEFNGELRGEQISAMEALLKYDNGVLSATTGFGKTVIGAKLIAEKKVNTLIIVHTQQLLEQWIKRLEEFLVIKEELLVYMTKKRGRKKKLDLIGQIGAGKNRLSGIIDVATMQSLVRAGEVKEIVKEYGMVIVDECHHVSAFSLEQILKNVIAKYVYGLTATPIRKDGHHPIIFMQCGPIRYRVDPIKQAEKRPFEHYVIPRFTSYKQIDSSVNKGVSITNIYADITESEIRNRAIVNDVINCVSEGRNPIVLTERTAHVEILSEKIKEKVANVITLTGAMTKKEKKEKMQKLENLPREESLVIVATGKFVGEGFDEPRLDTLFLAMPISWKGTLQQYAGRLHRVYDNKNEVQIYDYVDIYVGVLERMYQRRLKGYDSIGYYIKSGSKSMDIKNCIYNDTNFLDIFSRDIVSAKKEIVIVSSFIRKRRLLQMLALLDVVLNSNISVKIITRPQSDISKRYREGFMELYKIIEDRGVTLLFKSNIHQRFVVIDEKVCWYGGIDVLSHDNSEESIMRLENVDIAHELLEICSDVNKELIIQQKLF